MEVLPQTGVPAAISGGLVFVYNLLDKRIKNLEENKADITDVQVIRDYLKQLLEANDKRAENVEMLLRQLIQNIMSIHGCINKNSEEQDRLNQIIRDIKEHIASERNERNTCAVQGCKK